MQKYFISTSIPYVNADPHVGHALEFVEADVLARFYRLRGEVFFLTGTDDNALKNVQAAESAGVPITVWVEERADVFKELAEKLNISNNDFIRTSSDPRHFKGATKLWNSVKKEDIYKKNYQGLYCLGCEEFKTEKELVNGECLEHPGKKLEKIEEENYFFKLSNYQEKLLDLIKSNELKIIPETRKNEILKFIESGLEDFSISRSRERAKGWGVPVPGDDSQIMFVWLDALSNYINALGYAGEGENYKKYWQEADKIIHVIGKGINRFHTVYWPAMLLSAGVRPPTDVFVHGYLTADGKKISKSLGNTGPSPLALIEKYGVDAVRYFLLREIPSYEDGDFSIQKFEERYNADLANGLGNFTARVLTLAADTNLRINPNVPNKDIEKKIREAKKIVDQKLEEYKFNEAVAAIWDLIAFGDKYVNDNKPWEKSLVISPRSRTSSLRGRHKSSVIHNAVVILDNVAALLKPFLPETSEKITSVINWEDDTLKIKKLPPLFPRLQSPVR